MKSQNSDFNSYKELLRRRRTSHSLPEFQESWTSQLPKHSAEVMSMEYNMDTKSKNNFVIKLIAIAATIIIGASVTFFMVRSGGSSTALDKKQMRAVVVFAKGNVTKNNGIKLFQGDVVLENDTIITGDKSAVDIGLSDSSVIRLLENTNITLEKLSEQNSDPNVKLKLNIGKVFNVAPKLGKKGQFEVTTPASVAGVRGTSFFVSYDDKQNYIIEVAEGAVQVNSLLKDKKEFVVNKNDRVIINSKEESIQKNVPEISKNQEAVYKEMKKSLKDIMDEDTLKTIRSLKSANSEEELSKIYKQSVEILSLKDGREIRGVVVSQKKGKFIVQTITNAFIISESEIQSVKYP